MEERTTARSLVVSLLLVLSLAACGRDTTPPTTNPPPTPTTPAPREISDTVAEWTGGEAVVRAEDYNYKTGEPIVLVEGTISADGSLSLASPVGEDIPDDALSKFTEADICPTEQGVVNTIEITPSGPFVLAFPQFTVYDSTDSDYLGYLYLPGDSLETSYSYAYVASDVTVTGECVVTSSGSGGSASYTSRYDLDFKTGWNVVSSTNDGSGLSESTKPFPTDLTWVYLSEGPQPEPLPPPCEPDTPECAPPITPVLLLPDQR